MTIVINPTTTIAEQNGTFLSYHDSKMARKKAELTLRMNLELEQYQRELAMARLAAL